ncbi:hypothetical protein [Microbacterium hominis]|uniref:hypothetical protein n=1 Tax=Microbacterium hominis TaxID=162426 RepID=UPI0007686F74|nr:hypothetical protein [Microbacterium hominis]KXC06480.1 hypothetical protein MhomT_05255 [Microbacterium hominis]
MAAEDEQGIVVPYLLPASTDNKHFTRLGIHGYGFIPLRVPRGFDVFGQFHAADERIPLAALHFSAHDGPHPAARLAVPGQHVGDRPIGRRPPF